MTNSPFTTILFIVLMVVAFYLLILRPQRKRQQAQQKTMNELVPGTRVLLGSGVFGTVTWIGTKQATLEIAPGVELTVLKQAIARVVVDGDEYAEPEDAEDGIDEPVDADPDATYEDEQVVEPSTQSEPAGMEPNGVEPSRVEPSRIEPTREQPLPARPVGGATLDQARTSSGQETSANGPTTSRE